MEEHNEKLSVPTTSSAILAMSYSYSFSQSLFFVIVLVVVLVKPQCSVQLKLCEEKIVVFLPSPQVCEH